MTQREVNGKRGFVFHDDCWSLVVQAYYPSPVPLERLFQVLDSLPIVFTGGSINWGHDYGGLALLRGSKEDYFPWDERFADRLFPDGWSDTPYSVSPLALSEAEGILAETPQDPPSQPLAQSGIASPLPPSCGRDIFSSLPEELCTAIAAFLPTADVLSARLASRSFWNMFDSQQFWASRFRGLTSERSWLFEAAQELERTGGTRRRDWRWLYHRTTDAHLGPAAKNRKRVWGLIQHVAEILELSWSWNDMPSDLPPLWTPPPLPEEASPGPSWILVGGSLRGFGEDFSPLEQGFIKRLNIQRVAIPADGISHITASTVRLGGSTYIAGLAFTAASGHVLRLGYRAAAVRDEPSVRLEGLSLTGFNLAVGTGGIHALQCVSGGDSINHSSSWLGCSEDAPRTERLSRVASAPAMVLEFGFDVREPLPAFPPFFSLVSPADQSSVWDLLGF